MDRKQMLLRRLDHAWDSFQGAYAGLSKTELIQPGVIGLWSVKEIIAHVTTWEEEALKYLPLVLTGRRPPRYSVKYGGIDAFNSQTTAGKKSLSLTEVLRQRDEVHRQLVKLIQSVPDEHLNSRTRFWHRLRADTFGHYLKHAAAIQKWRGARITNDE